jgi:hypothetical protein
MGFSAAIDLPLEPVAGGSDVWAPFANRNFWRLRARHNTYLLYCFLSCPSCEAAIGGQQNSTTTSAMVLLKFLFLQNYQNNQNQTT